MFSSSGILIYVISICVISKEGRDHFRSQQVFSNVNRKPSSFKDVEKEGNSSNLKQNLSKDKLELNQITDTDKIHEEKSKEDPKVELKGKFPEKEITIVNDQVTVEIDLKQKEAKIIDMLDQVLQAEEDSYIEIISLKEENVEDQNMDPILLTVEPIPHRKSLSDLSDAGSDASFGNQVLSKYDVIAQVHREDLPKVDEDIKETNIIENNEEHEEMTAFNDSETNSRTDESGYSDTIDKSALNDSTEDAREDIPYIPKPPPFDENYFAQPYFKISYTVPSRSKRASKSSMGPETETKPRESIQSSNSNDGVIVFGSDRQVNFMSKLSNIFKHKLEGNDEVNLKRSNSTGDMKAAENAMIPERPLILLALQKEILAAHSSPRLRPVTTPNVQPVVILNAEATENEVNEDDSSMSRENLKSKLENIFAAGGPKPPKSKLMKSNPPTPEEAYQTDASSMESIPKIPKMEKNDTLKRQKDKFGDVLNSFRLSFNSDDGV